MLRSFLLIFSQITDKQMSYDTSRWTIEFFTPILGQHNHFWLKIWNNTQKLLHSLFPSRLLTFNWRWNEVADCLIACYTINILTANKTPAHLDMAQGTGHFSKHVDRCLRCHDNHDPSWWIMLPVSPGSGQHFLCPVFPCSHWPIM